MYRTILVPLDGSALAEEAIPHAAELARASKAGIHLVRVFDAASLLTTMPMPVPNTVSTVPSPEIYAAAREAEREEAEGYLQKQAAALKSKASKVEYSVQEGRPVEMLVALVEKLPADVVVMTSRGHGGFKRFVFGSVTDELLRRVEVPVLIVPNREP
jgi:nucleotide-binding universal stress UspA family protein